jgi:hypothetical protein
MTLHPLRGMDARSPQGFLTGLDLRLAELG